MIKILNRVVTKVAKHSSRVMKRATMRFSLEKKDQSGLAFVLGCQRSGTTMLIDLLGKSSFIYSYGEKDAPVMKRNCRISSYDAIRRELTTSPAHLTAMKPICDAQWANQLLDEFPTSKIVWIFRHYNDVINSALKRFDGQYERMRSFADNDWDQLEWRAEGIEKDHPTIQLLQKQYHNGADRVNAAALLLALRAGLYFDLHLDSNPRAMLVKYESLVSDPRKWVSKICDFIEVPFEEKLVADVHSRSVSKSNPPQLNPEVLELCEHLQSRLDSHWHQVNP